MSQTGTARPVDPRTKTLIRSHVMRNIARHPKRQILRENTYASPSGFSTDKRAPSVLVTPRRQWPTTSAKKGVARKPLIDVSGLDDRQNAPQKKAQKPVQLQREPPRGSKEISLASVRGLGSADPFDALPKTMSPRVAMLVDHCM